MFYSQRNFLGTDGENIFSGNLCVMKTNKKPIYYVIFNIAVLKTLSTRGGVILIFLEKLLFKLYSIPLPTIKGVLYFKWKSTLSKTIECLSMSLVVHKETFLFSSCLEFFLARSTLFQIFMACFGSFHFLQVATSQWFIFMT